MNMQNGNSMFEMSEYSERIYASFSGRFFHKRRLSKLVEICRALGGSEVLEIGCHDLLFYHCLNKDYKRYVGIDVNWEHGLDFARKNKQKFGWGNVEIFEGFAESLPVEDQSFDLILCFETIEHLSSEREAIHEIARVLKPGGTLLISVPIEFGFMLLPKVLLRLLLRRKLEYTMSELITSSILCNPTKIERNEHKGYDYRKTIGYLSACDIDIQRIYRYPFAWLPDWLNMGVMTVLRKRRQSEKRAGTGSNR